MNYAKFIEVAGKKNYIVKELNLLAKMISSDETRYFMNFAYCEDGKLISTDGRRMCIYENSAVSAFGFKDGKMYRYLKGTKTISWWAELETNEGQFPNWKRITDQLGKPVSSCQYESYSIFDGRFSKEYCKLIKTNAVNINHIKDFSNKSALN